MEKKLAGLPRDRRLMLNVHLDGMESTHDRLAGRAGVFAAAIRGVRAARTAGFRVYTNTTVYRETEMHELAVLFGFLTGLGVDGLMISPAYGYEAVRRAEPDGSPIFMTREEIHARFRELCPMLRSFRLTATPLYLDFLCGRRALGCAAWASPTRNVARLEEPLLSGDRRALRFLPRAAGTHGLGRAWAGPRPALRTLPGPLRLRAGRLRRATAASATCCAWPSGRWVEGGGGRGIG